jgi:DNA-binding winged helix-turn-helix (wHTH) protein/TolB-like protein
MSSDQPPEQPAGAPSVVRFGVFELDLRTAELRRAGVRVPLQELPFKLLVMLLERPGEVVSREQLRGRLWPGEFVEFDQGLNTAIRKLRTALDDSADSPRFIETLARRGYRFIAPVTSSGHGADEQRSAAAPSQPKRRRFWYAATAAVIAAALAVSFFTRSSPRPAPAARGPISAIAVLPFANDQPRLAHLSDGLTEQLIDDLSVVPGLRVMARTTVFQYQGKRIDPRDAGEELGVDAVVIGTVGRAGQSHSVRVEVVDVRDGSQVWGERFEAHWDRLPELEQRISEGLMRSLQRGPATRLARSTSADAYDLYLRGLQAWNRRGVADLRRAVDLFTRATEIDPQFASAYAGLANAWGVMVGYGLISPAEATPRILAAARKALELDPSNAEAYTSIATTKFRHSWDFDGADEDYRRALQLNPNYATGHSWYAQYLQAMGRFDDARRHIELAYSLDPMSEPIAATRCHTLSYERRFEEAAEFYEKITELDPDSVTPHCGVRAYLALGDYESAMKTLDRFQSADSRESIAAYRAGGRDGYLRKRLEIYLRRERPEYRSPVEIALVYAQLGERDRAFHWLETAYRNRVSRLTWFHLDHELDFLRDDPRFESLRERIGLPKFDPPARPRATQVATSSR